jgi:hypothetical protein
MKSGAVKRYYVIAEYRSAFLHQLRELVQTNHANNQHSDMQSTRMGKDECAVQAVIFTIQSWINLFAPNQSLAIISTGKQASEDIKHDLLQAHDIGKNKYENFKTERLATMPPIKKFHDSMKLSKL